jgi:hypothetical protein
VLHRRNFFQGRAIRGSGVQDIAWLGAGGHELSDRDWQSDLRCFGMLLPGNAIDETDDRGRRIVGSTLFVMYNAGADAVPFMLPRTPTAERWTRVFDTAHPAAAPAEFAGVSHYARGRSVVVLRTPVPAVTTPPTPPSLEEHAMPGRQATDRDRHATLQRRRRPLGRLRATFRPTSKAGAAPSSSVCSRKSTPAGFRSSAPSASAWR